MKKFIDIMSKDIMSENFTHKELVIYGVVAPLALIAVCVFVSWIETL